MTRFDAVPLYQNRPFSVLCFPVIEVVAMPNILALTSICLWFVLMFWLYQSIPSWFFVPFFVAATLCYLKMMEAGSSQ
ncbi:hypothetical protein IQ266_19090 [filamentous cyanobacterium LEGE 11480]|uniref:Uncharacterized protein n=1 Tax=Romeriopsis navalis LEGE 11480 TaxID=2777977 RepID=A0A928VP20_9CYAN|nr:hypothetical protein [Romeriopsis navalis]MBE9031845.1 hypothetical protein [Romeriopsis navalis LEGE 11480]